MHWLVVIVIALVVFGPKRLPELGRSLGTGMRGFRDSLEGKDEPRPEDHGARSPAPPPSEDVEAGRAPDRAA
jgi:sec-independent protein translocase protein TatA